MESNHLIQKKVLPSFFLSLLMTVVGMVVGMLFIPTIVALGVLNNDCCLNHFSHCKEKE
ncbi:hypothetical protein LCL96_01560 [Rossellomorea aquimaris]|uniref:hypothetical protein n=1 Tax=Rossellomorea aquimaris TaxID=189382 RepID=UPI001CD4A336|nr:hypothetical protein [Rossellomorea aquimaris]MCA1057602.1 hypothetical protein [Rossellomorea aquimaris]